MSTNLRNIIFSFFLMSSVVNAITYQGELSNVGGLYTGNADLEFSLYDSDIDGNSLGAVDLQTNVAISNGRFVVELSQWMGELDGRALWLQIAASIPSGGSLTILSPRQKIGVAPYAEFSYDTDNTLLQVRVSGACNVGESIRAINVDGTVICETDDNSGGDISAVTVSGGLTGGGITGSVDVGFDATVVHGSEPIVIVSPVNSVITSGFTYETLATITITHPSSGYIALSGTTRALCSNCGAGNTQGICRFGFTDSIAIIPSPRANGFSQYLDSQITQSHPTIFTSKQVFSNGTSTFYLRGSSTSGLDNCTFSDIRAMAIFQPN